MYESGFLLVFILVIVASSGCSAEFASGSKISVKVDVGTNNIV